VALSSALAETRQAVADKDVLLQEVHHRVKNNLQIVNSLGDVPAHVANGQALLINDYAASPVQARPLSLVAVAECAA